MAPGWECTRALALGWECRTGRGPGWACRWEERAQAKAL